VEHHFIEKSEMVEHLEIFRSNNMVAFNQAAIKECDIVSGFLFRAIDDNQFKDDFLSYDIILNMTDEYYSTKQLVWARLTLLLFVYLLLHSLVRLGVLSFKFNKGWVPIRLNTHVQDQLNLVSTIPNFFLCHC
jgi:hypothetical protein